MGEGGASLGGGGGGCGVARRGRGVRGLRGYIRNPPRSIEQAYCSGAAHYADSASNLQERARYLPMIPVEGWTVPWTGGTSKLI